MSYSYFYYYFRHRISRDMEVDEMSTSFFYVCFIREFDIIFFEMNSKFFIHSSGDRMFIEATKDFCSNSF